MPRHTYSPRWGQISGSEIASRRYKRMPSIILFMCLAFSFSETTYGDGGQAGISTGVRFYGPFEQQMYNISINLYQTRYNSARIKARNRSDATNLHLYRSTHKAILKSLMVYQIKYLALNSNE